MIAQFKSSRYHEKEKRIIAATACAGNDLEPVYTRRYFKGIRNCAKESEAQGLQARATYNNPDSGNMESVRNYS